MSVEDNPKQTTSLFLNEPLLYYNGGDQLIYIRHFVTKWLIFILTAYLALFRQCISEQSQRNVW